jgi:predicted RNase H-like HicB family nuclease
MHFTAAAVTVPEEYVAFVEELPGANTQSDTPEEVRANLWDAVALVLAANREMAEQALAGQSVTKEPFALPTP